MNMGFITRFFPWTQTARFRRFELLLPITYNNGTDVEPEKFESTRGELSSQFNGLTQDLVQLQGLWKFAGQSYQDKLLRIRTDSDDPNAVKFLRSYKETLKDRFQQLDIWITAHEIEII